MKYFFGFLICVGLIVLVIILIIRGFTGDSKKTTQTPLVNYATTAVEVRMKVGGPIVNDNEHNSYTITVNRDQATVETVKGYQNTVVNSLSFANNHEAYANFLRALDFAGFTKGNKQSPNKDERGACATGRRFVLEIKDGAEEKQRFWTTSCGNQGNFSGNIEQVRQLFNSQIPKAELTKALRGLRL